MATKTLSASIDLKTTDNVIGIFDLDSVTAQNLSYDDTVVSSASVTVPHGGTGLQIVAKVAGTKVVYVWIKNMEAAGGNFVVLKNDDAQVWGRLLPGEWGFFPAADVAGLKLVADTASCLCEYAIFQSP